MIRRFWTASRTSFIWRPARLSATAGGFGRPTSVALFRLPGPCAAGIWNAFFIPGPRRFAAPLPNPWSMKTTIPVNALLIWSPIPAARRKPSVNSEHFPIFPWYCAAVHRGRPYGAGLQPLGQHLLGFARGRSVAFHHLGSGQPYRCGSGRLGRLGSAEVAVCPAPEAQSLSRLRGKRQLHPLEGSGGRIRSHAWRNVRTTGMRSAECASSPSSV